jgi:hypothetical protein
MPNITRLLAARLALGLLALVCVLYALYITFLMPPLVKYGTAGGYVDGRVVCAALGQRADENYHADYHRRNPDSNFGNPFVAISAEGVAHKVVTDCLSETAVDTPLLALKVAVLLIVGAASALLAFRLRT